MTLERALTVSGWQSFKVKEYSEDTGPKSLEILRRHSGFFFLRHCTALDQCEKLKASHHP